jgi:hypothetical protein
MGPIRFVGRLVHHSDRGMQYGRRCVQLLDADGGE